MQATNMAEAEPFAGASEVEPRANVAQRKDGRRLSLFRLCLLASIVMDTDVVVLPADTSFDEFLRWPDHAGRMRHVVPTRRGRIFGVIRVNTSLAGPLKAPA